MMASCEAESLFSNLHVKLNSGGLVFSTEYLFKSNCCSDALFLEISVRSKNTLFQRICFAFNFDLISRPLLACHGHGAYAILKFICKCHKIRFNYDLVLQMDVTKLSALIKALRFQ